MKTTNEFSAKKTYFPHQIGHIALYNEISFGIEIGFKPNWRTGLGKSE
jgi:hypothetical protein